MNQIRKGLKATPGSERGVLVADDASGRVDFGPLQTQKDAMDQI